MRSSLSYAQMLPIFPSNPALRFFRRMSYVCCLISFIVPSLLSQPSPISHARQFIADSMAARQIPGVSITVMRDGKIVWSEGFGFADLEQRVPVTNRTKFRVGSVSKSLTATALGMLWEEGRMHFDSTVQTYVPSFPRKRWPITVRQVAGHLAGIRHYRGDEMLIRRHYNTVTDALAIFEDDSLLTEPGTRYAYSSYGWNLLSAVVEAASGEDFLGYMQRRVFDPIGMKNTVADHVDSLIAFRARWYTNDSLNAVVNATYVDNSYKWAGGGFLSTTEDLAKFGDAMLERHILKPATVDLLWSPQRLKNGTPTTYGIGWFVRPDPKGRSLVAHSGGSVGGTAMLAIWPKERLVVSMLVNSDMPFTFYTLPIAEMFMEE